jgi:hypothetical protein
MKKRWLLYKKLEDLYKVAQPYVIKEREKHKLYEIALVFRNKLKLKCPECIKY